MILLLSGKVGSCQAFFDNPFHERRIIKKKAEELLCNFSWLFLLVSVFNPVLKIRFWCYSTWHKQKGCDTVDSLAAGPKQPAGANGGKRESTLSKPWWSLKIKGRERRKAADAFEVERLKKWLRAARLYIWTRKGENVNASNRRMRTREFG